MLKLKEYYTYIVKINKANKKIVLQFLIANFSFSCTKRYE